MSTVTWPCPLCDGKGCEECDGTGQRYRQTWLSKEGPDGSGITVTGSGSGELSDETVEAIQAVARAAFERMNAERACPATHDSEEDSR